MSTDLAIGSNICMDLNNLDYHVLSFNQSINQ